jgi:hypothetical protein
MLVSVIFRSRWAVFCVLGLVLGSVAVAQAGARAAQKDQIKTRLIQEATWHLPNATYQTQLRLFAIGPTLGKNDGQFLGTMEFTWKLHGVCSSSAASCSGTADLVTVTKLPGGTISAAGKGLSISKGFIVPIQSGTGTFKGVSGTIDIAPNGQAEDVFNLTLP